MLLFMIYALFQFDNYLEDQGDDISDVEDTGIGYTASFAAGTVSLVFTI